MQLEREGKPLLLTRTGEPGEARTGPPRGSLEAMQAFFREWGHVLADEEYVRTMKEARRVYNEPWEPRTSWE